MQQTNANRVLSYTRHSRYQYSYEREVILTDNHATYSCQFEEKNFQVMSTLNKRKNVKQ